jgi:NACalpha-BTF3-like transcription factor
MQSTCNNCGPDCRVPKHDDIKKWKVLEALVKIHGWEFHSCPKDKEIPLPHTITFPKSTNQMHLWTDQIARSKLVRLKEQKKIQRKMKIDYQELENRHNFEIQIKNKQMEIRKPNNEFHHAIHTLAFALFLGFVKESQKETASKCTVMEFDKDRMKNVENQK